jgi:type IV pilus assembly protein PilW
MSLALQQRGSGLLAIMVGLVISFAVSLGVYSSLSMFEANRREMIGGDASLENAVAALSEVQWGVKHAGTSVIQSGSLYCPTINIYYDGEVIADGAALAPVRIADGGAGNDEVTVAYGNSLFGAMTNRVMDPMPSPSSILKVNTGVGLAVGDLFLIGLPGSGLPCTLMQTTHLADTGYGTNVQHNPGVAAPWNPPNPVHEFTNAPSYPAGSILMKIGTLNWKVYRVRSNRLEVVDVITGEIDVVAEHIVGFKARYGTSDGTNKNIEQWVAATGAWQNPTAAQIAAIRGVQLAALVRSPHHVKSTAADGTCNATASSTVDTWAGGPTFDLTTYGTDWACFKYRVLTLVVPLRNVLYGETT